MKWLKHGKNSKKIQVYVSGRLFQKGHRVERQGLNVKVKFKVDEEEGYRTVRRIPLGGLSP